MKSYKNLLHWAQNHFGENIWTFQQDSAPAHKAKKVQTWCNENFPDFINSQQWPSNSPDLNPLDYSVWGIMEAKACAKPHKSIQELKLSLKKAWNELSLDTIAKIVDNFP